jgi:hypothetical protein
VSDAGQLGAARGGWGDGGSGGNNTDGQANRLEDYVEEARKAKTLLEKHGARNCRLLSGVVAGEATGGVVFTCEVDDFAGAGVVLDKFLADPEGLAVMASTNAADGPVAGYQTAFWMDIPL